MNGQLIKTLVLPKRFRASLLISLILFFGFTGKPLVSYLKANHPELDGGIAASFVGLTCIGFSIATAFILSVNYRSLRPETWVFLIITGLSLVPVCLGYAVFPTLMMWSMVGLMWEDAKKAQRINPYPWYFSMKLFAHHRDVGHMPNPCPCRRNQFPRI